MNFYEYMDKEIPGWKLSLDNEYVEKIRGDYLYVTNMKILLKELFKELETNDNDYKRGNIKNLEEAIQRHSDSLKKTVETAKKNKKETKYKNLYEDVYKETQELIEAAKRINGYREKYEKDHEEVKHEIELARQMLEEQEREKKL